MSIPKKKMTKLHSAVRTLLSSEAMNAPVTALSLEEQAYDLALLKFVEDILDKRKTVLRDSVIEQVAQKGEVSDEKKGHLKMVLGEVTCIREKRVDLLPDEKELKKLLQVKKINLLDVFDEVKTVRLNPSKLSYMTDTGKIPAQDIETLKGTAFALKAKPSKSLEEAFELLQQPVSFGSD